MLDDVRIALSLEGVLSTYLWIDVLIVTKGSNNVILVPFLTVPGGLKTTTHPPSVQFWIDLL